MATANQKLFDRSLRHEIDVRRYSNQELARMLKYLEQMDADTVALLRSRLPSIGKEGVPEIPGRDLSDYQYQRYQELLTDIRLLRKAAMKEAEIQFTDDMFEFVPQEAQFQTELLSSVIPMAEITVATVSAAQVRSAVFARPFQGKLLKDWFSELEVQDAARLRAAIQDGFVTGQTTDQIVRNIVGTRASQYSDGILAISRRNATAIARTALNSYASAAREEIWKENTDIIVGMRWTSMLDGRTSAICRARDGDIAPVGGNEPPPGASVLSPPGARPPAHFNCRSTMIPVMDWENMAGNKPTITDTRTRKAREVDFRANAKAQAGDKWKTYSPEQRNALIKKQREAWAESAIGTVPAKTTYNDWLKQQPAGFQDDVLGKTKGKLFREGGLEMDQFVDRQGNELTLAQLKQRHPTAFEEAEVE